MGWTTGDRRRRFGQLREPAWRTARRTRNIFTNIRDERISAVPRHLPVLVRGLLVQPLVPRVMFLSPGVPILAGLFDVVDSLNRCADQPDFCRDVIKLGTLSLFRQFVDVSIQV